MRSKSFPQSTFLFILVLLVLNLGNVYGQEKTNKKDRYLVSPETFKSQIEKNRNIVILDVRTPEEYEASHIKGSINVDYRSGNFIESVTEFDKNKKYYVYCRTGRRSANSREIMNELGFKKVYDLDGGIVSWQEHDLPLEKPRAGN